MVLPAGFELPPAPYAGGVLVAAAVVAGVLWHVRPPISDRVVIGLAPWMVIGAGLHVLYQIDAAPRSLAPLFGAPTVYVVSFVFVGVVWLAASVLAPTGADRPVARVLGIVGTVATIPVVAAVLMAGDTVGGLQIRWPVVGLVVATALTALTVGALWRLRPQAIITTGRVGTLVVFAHALDGVSTAIGVDVLGYGERTPASAAILEFAAMLPTADVLGVGWLFVLVKLVVAAMVVWLFTDYVREMPARGYLLLAAVVAVGLGPGVNNLLLYAVG